MVPGINAGEVGWLDDTGTLVTAMKIAGTNRPWNRIPVEYLTGVDDVVLLSNISNGSGEGGGNQNNTQNEYPMKWLSSRSSYFLCNQLILLELELVGLKWPDDAVSDVETETTEVQCAVNIQLEL